MKPLNDTAILRLTAGLEQEDDFVFLESSRLSEENHRSFLFRRPSAYLCCQPGDSAGEFLARVDQARARGQYLAGWLAYEFGYLLEPCLRRFLPESSVADKPLALLGVYEAPLIFDHKNGEFSNGSDWPFRSFEAEKHDVSSCTELTTTVTRPDYIRAIQAVQEYIRAGDTYQVNFTLHFDFRFQGSVAALYRALRRNQSVAYSAWIRHQGRDILSFSPELFFTADSEKVRVRPMKGTMSRGRTNAEDAARQQELRTDPKNQSENVMIVDLLRNDLGRLLYGGDQKKQEKQGKTQGRVQPRSLFDVETYESLLQMTSTIDGILELEPQGRGADSPLSFQRLIKALFPCGSVTGAPKIRTMEIIHELEQQPRGVYCGAVGYTGPDRSCFNVPIRTLELRKGQGRMGIGSGIVADSVAEAEWEECLLKGNFLTKSSKSTADFQLIETLLWRTESGYFLLDYHLERLQDSARYFHFCHDPEEVRGCFNRTAAELSAEVRNKEGARQWRVRLLLYRDGRLEITSVPLPEPEPEPASADAASEEPARVIFSREQVDAGDPHRLHKTTRRELYTREFQRAAEQGCADVLFTNTAGEVTEGAITNIFIRRQKNERLLTPPISCGLLAGTYRRMLLEQGRAIEQVLRMEDILKAEELYTANSVRGLVPVRLRREQADEQTN